MRNIIMLSLLMAAAVGLLAPTAAVAAVGQLPGARHGGTVTETTAHAFETVLAADGVHVYLLTDEFAPAMVDKAAGTARLKLPDGRMLELALVGRRPIETEPGTYFCPMHAEVVQDKAGVCDLCGGMTLFAQDHLFGAADLSGANLAGIGAMIRLTGLRGSEKEVTFSPAFPTPDLKAATTNSGN